MIKQPVYEDNYENHIAFMVRNLDGDLKDKEIERLNILHKSKHQGFTCSESQRLAKLYLDANYQPKVPKPLSGLAKVLDQKLLVPPPEIVTKYTAYQPFLNLVVTYNKQGVTTNQVIVINMEKNTYAIFRVEYLSKVYDISKVNDIIRNVVVEEKYLVAYINLLDARTNELFTPLKRTMKVDYVDSESVFKQVSIIPQKEALPPVLLILQNIIADDTNLVSNPNYEKLKQYLENIKTYVEFQKVDKEIRDAITVAPAKPKSLIEGLLTRMDKAFVDAETNKTTDLDTYTEAKKMVDYFRSEFMKKGYQKTYSSSTNLENRLEGKKGHRKSKYLKSSSYVGGDELKEILVKVAIGLQEPILEYSYNSVYDYLKIINFQKGEEVGLTDLFNKFIVAFAYGP